MKTTLKTTGLILALAFAISACGSKANKTETSDSDTLQAATPSACPIKLSVIEPEDPCGPGEEGYRLVIHGGTEPYKVKAEANDYGMDITDLRFSSEEGTASVHFSIIQGNLPEEGVTLRLIVTDSAGITASLDIFVNYCL